MQIRRYLTFFISRIAIESRRFNTRKKPQDFVPKVVNRFTDLLKTPQNNIFIFESLAMGKSKGGFYAVARGRTPGIYHNWDACKAQVEGFPNARFKKFGSNEEAQQFITENSSVPRGNVGTINVSQAFSTTKKQNGQVPTSALPSTSHAASQSGTQPSRNFSTTPVLNKRKIKVTDGTVTNKRMKTGATSNKTVDLKDFTVEDGYVVVYTDGACTKNGQSGAKAGIGIWFGDDHALNMSEPVRGRQTNNTAEILAAEQAIVKAKLHGIDKLNVKTDSQFVIKCITQWIQKWKKNGWKLATGRPVVNQNDLEKLDCAMTNMDIKWSYVPGHKGHYGNECADRLAVEGASKP